MSGRHIIHASAYVEGRVDVGIQRFEEIPQSVDATIEVRGGMDAIAPSLSLLSDCLVESSTPCRTYNFKVFAATLGGEIEELECT